MGWEQDKMNASVQACCVGDRSKGEKREITWDNARNKYRKKQERERGKERRSCDSWVCDCVTAVGKIVVQRGGSSSPPIRMQHRGHQWLMCAMGNSRLCSLSSIYSVRLSPPLAFTSLNSFFCSFLVSRRSRWHLLVYFCFLDPQW